MEPKPKVDSESEFSVLESVDDNEEISKDSVSDTLGNSSESKVLNNGSCAEVDNDNELFPDVSQNETEVLGSVNSPPGDLKPEVYLSPARTTKGHGLKRWKRINRDVNKGGKSSLGTNKMATQDLVDSGVNSSKRMQVYGVRKLKTEASVSSKNAIIRNLDGFPPLDDSGFVLGAPFTAGTDSDNSEDRSSKSSTAASTPEIKFETPLILGFFRDKNRTSSLSEKNWTHAVQRGQLGKGHIETTKKAKGEQVKIEKESSRSSVKSDLQGSNLVFLQGTYSNNGIHNERLKDYEGNCDGAQGGKQPIDAHRGDYGRDDNGEYKDLSPEDVVGDSSWEVKEERSKHHCSSRDQDLLVEPIFALQSAQEALEKEVLKFKDIGKDISVNGQDLVIELISAGPKIQKTSSKRLLHGEGVRSFPTVGQSEVVEKTNGDVETELEHLFKEKIEAEVEYLTISRMVQKLRVASVDQISILEEQKALASEHAQILNKLVDAGNKAAMLKEAEKSENLCDDISSADETLKLQKRVCKYSSFFILQLVWLLVILTVFIFQISPSHMEPVPT